MPRITIQRYAVRLRAEGHKHKKTMKKYRLTNKTITVTRNGKEVTLHRIEALRDFGNIKAGDLGGCVESEANLSHDGNCWVYDNAKVYDSAKVYGNAKVYDSAKVYDNAKVYDSAKVYDNAWISNNAEVCGYAKVYGNAEVYGNALVYGNAKIYGDVEIYGIAEVGGYAKGCGGTVLDM